MAVKESDVVKLKRTLAEKKVAGAYLFYGQELYLRDIYIERFCALIPKDDFREFNLITLEGRSLTQEGALDAIESFPIGAEQKLVIIRDSGIFKKPKENDVDFWNEEIKNLPDYCILLFVEDDVDKRSSVYKTLKKYGTDVEFAYLKEYELCSWVQGQVLKAKRKMDKNVIEYFVSICQAGLINLNNELQKLITYCDEDITLSDVKRVVAKSLDVQIFDLSDAIMNKDADRALGILNDLKTVKESAFTILYLLNSAFDKMLLSKLMLSDGQTTRDVEQKLGLHPFIAKKYYSGAGGFSEQFLKDRVKSVPELDLAIKQGKLTDWEALYKFVFDALRA